MSSTKTSNYQQTEGGLIPEDWEVATYGEAFQFLNSATFSRAQLKNDSEVKCIHYGDIHTKFKNILDFSDIEIDGCSRLEAKKYDLIQDGDVVMADASEDIEGIGKSIEIKNLNKKAIAGLHTFLLRDRGFFAKGFKGYIHEIKSVKLNLEKLATGLKVYGVSKTNLKKIPIPVPTLTEQKAIATALSDADELIADLEKLIAKKKAIKEGAMQELLRPPGAGAERSRSIGGKRLPGFDGEWEEKKLGEVFNFKQGLQCAIDEQFEMKKNNRVRFIRIIDLTNSNEPPRYISNPEKSHIITNDDLFMVRYGSPGLLGYGYSGVIANNLFRLMPKSKVDTRFFYYLLQYKNQDILNLSSSTTMSAISFGPLTQMNLAVSPNIEEQKAIAKILSEMDEELEALEQKKVKYEQVKQGMMQELLRGKTRLV